MIITKRSMISGNIHDMDIPLTEEQYEEGLNNKANGALIQDAFPTLTDEQREFILTGITPEEWDATFPEEDDPDNFFGLNDDLTF